MSNLDDHVGARIRLYRKSRNISIKELADMIHKGRSAVSKYENGRISLDVNTLADIAGALDIQVSQLVDFPEERKSSRNILKGGLF